jgi:hypothetical protein
MRWRWREGWNKVQIPVIVDQQYLTFSPPLPFPPLLRGSAYFSYLVPYHCPVCPFAHGHTGVFHKNFLRYKLLALIYLNNSIFCLSSRHGFFAHLGNSSLPKNLPFLCGTKILRNLFPALLLLHSPFNKPMPITFFEGIKHPCNSTGTKFLGFMREREIGDRLG